MTQKEMTELNLGQSLDDISNIDPRGYGVSRILYAGSRGYTQHPLSMNAAKKLMNDVKQNDFTFILTGFVLLPSRKAETDGLVGSVFLAKALVKAFGARPVIICPQECMGAIVKMADCTGLDLYTSFGKLPDNSSSIMAASFTKDIENAFEFAQDLISQCRPSAVVSVECPGANEVGIYHNSAALNLTEYEAKTDVLFEMLVKAGVTNIAIGDLGNETGMGTIGEHIKKYIPNGEICCCGCGGGICARTKADNIITSTVSDWGCYVLIAALAYLKKDLDILHTAEEEEKVLIAAANNGIIDMCGLEIPCIDGFGIDINKTIVNLMRECVDYAIKLEKKCVKWFEMVDNKGFFNKSII